MNSSDIAAFRADLLTSRDFIMKMIIRQPQLSALGPRAMAEWDDYPAAVAALGRLELHLARAVALAKESVPSIQDKLKTFAEKSPLALQAAEIPLSVQLAEVMRSDGQMMMLARKTATVFKYVTAGGVLKTLFTRKSELPLRQMVIDIERLLPFVDMLQATVDAPKA